MWERDTPQSNGYTVDLDALKKAQGAMESIAAVLANGVIRQINPGAQTQGSALDSLRLTAGQLGPDSGAGSLAPPFQSALDNFIAQAHLHADDLIGRLNEAASNLEQNAISYRLVENMIEQTFKDLFNH